MSHAEKRLQQFKPLDFGVPEFETYPDRWKKQSLVACGFINMEVS